MTDQTDQITTVAMIADFPEERWESMNYVAEMIQLHFQKRPDLNINLRNITPEYRRVFSRIHKYRLFWNLDRLINRRLVLPLALAYRLRREQFDTALIVDHSYAHVAPMVRRMMGRCVVICHDTDAISAISRKSWSPLGLLHRWLAASIYKGLHAADKIITVSQTVKDELIAKYAMPDDKVDVIYNGIAEEFTDKPTADESAFQGYSQKHWPVLVHVGSVIPRKRIDLLIRVVSELKSKYPELICLRVGGQFTDDQLRMVDELKVADTFEIMPRLTRAELAAVYRLSTLVLVTSDAEGFGLPVVESLACGATVLASDLPVLREVGGRFAHYATAGNCNSFVSNAMMIIENRQQANHEYKPSNDARNSFLSQYQWATTVAKMALILHQRDMRI